MPNIGVAKPDGRGGYTVTLDETQLAELKALVTRLQLNGVTQIVAMQYPLIPHDFPKFVGKDGNVYSTQDLIDGVNTSGEVRMDYYAFPEPGTKEYGTFMDVQEEYFRLLSKAVPGITHYEGINEPERGSTTHKIGWLTASERTQLLEPDSYPSQEAFEYSLEEIAQITVDYCHAITSGVRKANSGAKVLSSGLTILSIARDYLEAAYTYIDSEDNHFADNNADNYFEILNWHPYVFISNTGNPELASGKVSSWGKEHWGEKWVAFQKSMYNVAVAHGDANTPVWFTELGQSDYGMYDESHTSVYGGVITEELVGLRVREMMELITSELDFVDTVIGFRLFDKADSATDGSVAGEGNYGMIEQFDNVSSGEEALKVYGLTYYRIVKGETASTAPLTRVLEKYYNIYQGTYPLDQSEDFESAIVRNNTFVSNHSDITVSYSSGADYLMKPEMSITSNSGNKKLTFDYSETISTTLNAQGVVANPVTHIRFDFGKIEAGTYKVTFNVSGRSLDGIGYWGTTWMGVTTNSTPHNWTHGAIQNMEHNEGGPGIALYRNGQSTQFQKNELTFTVTERQDVSLVFQISGNVQGGVSKGAFRVMFDDLMLTKISE